MIYKKIIEILVATKAVSKEKVELARVLAKIDEPYKQLAIDNRKNLAAGMATIPLDNLPVKTAA